MLLAVLHLLVGLLLPLSLLHLPGVVAAMPEGAAFWAAVFGPTVASWGVLMMFLAHFGLRQRQRWACDALLLALLVWAPFDAWLCARAGFLAAVWLDLIVLPLLLIPLLLLRRGFPAG